MGRAHSEDNLQPGYAASADPGPAQMDAIVLILALPSDAPAVTWLWEWCQVWPVPCRLLPGKLPFQGFLSSFKSSPGAVSGNPGLG